MNDLRFAFRQLLKSPGFTAVVVLTLALRIGANTTIFSITNGLLLRPLPVREPERLVALFTTYEKQSGLSGTSYPDYRDLRDRNNAFEGLAARFYFPMALRTADRAEVVMGHVISWDYFEVLGVSPAVGRAFLPEEDQAPGARPVAMLSHRFWQARLLGDPEVIGIARDGKYDRLSEAPQPYLYQALAQSDFVKRLHLHVRTTADTKAWIPAVARTIRELDPNLPPPRVLTVPQFLEQAVDAIAGPVEIVGAFGVLALALAMVGVYGVMAYTVNQRTHEIGVRMALGARRADVLKLVVRQGMGAVGLGMILGLGANFGLLRLLASQLYEVSTVDLPTYGEAALLILMVALAACYLPARRATRVDPMVALRFE